MEMKEKMSKKKIVIGVLIGLVILFLVYDFTPIIKVPFGYMKYGSEKCNKTINEHISLAQVEVYDRCGLCYRTNTGTGMVPKLCSHCASQTNRCEKCGKLNAN